MDPTLKNRTLTSLKEKMPMLSPRLRIVAKYIVDHPSDFGLDSIRETARKSGVSTYTLVRAANNLGFDSYDQLREPFRHALVSSTGFSETSEWLTNLRQEGELGRVQADAAANTLAIIERTLHYQTTDQMQQVVDLLLSARTVYLTAVRASYSLAYYLQYVGRMALPTIQLIPRYKNSAIDDLNDADDDDVMIAITFTPYSRETIDACKFAVRRGVKLIVISDSNMISSEFQADFTLVASVISTHHFACFSSGMALIENLLALLVQQGGAPARDRIKSYEDLRNKNNAYWIAKK
jgi:DNA-binding MurR/RpiR family transcriptional regulator